MSETRNSSLLGKITVLFIICCCSLPAQGKYGGGSGTTEDPYLIYTAKQLNEIGHSGNWDDLDKCFKLMSNIDLSSYTGTSFNIIGNSPGKPFIGVFDGNGHTISNFTYTSTETDYIGLFAFVGHFQSDGEINNLGLFEPNVNAGKGNYVGSLIGRLLNGTVNNCRVEGGSVAGASEIGGLLGRNSGTISNCYATGDVTGDEYVGGLVGINNDTISNCYAAGSVVGVESAGGLVGFEYDSRYAINSYWDIETSGQDVSAGGEGKTTDEMKTASTFVYWGDCGEAWTINEGVDYPRLVWEHKPGEPIVGIFPLEGDGGPDNPYLICTADELNVIGKIPCLWDKHFQLLADIDLSGFTGDEFNIIGNGSIPFSGVFDGNNHTIANFTYDSNNKDYTGLFGRVYHAQITDLKLNEVNIDAGTKRYVGSIAGYLDCASVRNCQANNVRIVGGSRVGGLVGWSYSGDITDCSTSGVVEASGIFSGGLVGICTEGWVFRCHSNVSVTAGSQEAGGLLGRNDEGIVSQCYSTGSASATYRAGGLVGNNWRGTISSCYSEAYVSATVSHGGGLAGSNMQGSYINNSYATGNITSDSYVGGLVGYNEIGTIEDCYSVGFVTGTVSHIGGLVGGTSSDAAAIDCFWDVNSSGCDQSDGGTGLSTERMQDANTFLSAGWDFIGEYKNGPSQDWAAPTIAGNMMLWWQVPEGELPELPGFSGGTGGESEPYLIANPNDLNRIGHNSRLMDKNFQLISDVNLSDSAFYLIGRPGSPFTGTFDGKGHSIVDLTIDIPRTNSVGMFGSVRGHTAVIRDLSLEGARVSAGTGRHGTGVYIGSLIGRLHSGTVSGCRSNGIRVSGSRYVGGLVGRSSGTIIECSYSGEESATSTSDSFCGGVVGCNEGTIFDCSAFGQVSGPVSIGGLVGDNKGTIDNSFAEVTVSGSDSSCGGLVGGNWGQITRCYSVGSVIGNDSVGGLAGSNYNGTISKCYSAAVVRGNYDVGGLVGWYDSTVLASFWDIEASGQFSSKGGTGKWTYEMQMQITFTNAGWDFIGETANGTEDIWRLCEDHVGYPRLAWEFPLGDFLCPDGVNFFDFSFFAERWAEDNCGASNDCDGRDLDLLGTVEINDLGIFVDNWMRGF